MYRKQSKIIVSTEDPSNYVEGCDVYNSLLVSLLRDYPDEKESYLITARDYRPDLIAKDIYGDSKWMGLLMMTCGLGLEGYRKGTVLQVYPRTTLERILRSL